MPLNKKTFFETYESFALIEKAVFFEIAHELLRIALRPSIPKYLQPQWQTMKLIPDDRNLNKIIWDYYTLTNKKHQKAYLVNVQYCLALLIRLQVIELKTKIILFKSVKIKINKELLLELKELLAKKDEKTLRVPVYRIIYQEPAIMLEGVTSPLKTTYYDSQSEIVFDYVFHHSGRDITRKEINDYLMKEQKGSINRDLDDIFFDLGFRDKLLQVFLKKKTKHLIHFRNPVYYSDLKEIGIEYCEPAELLPTPKKRKKNKMKILKNSMT